MILFHGWESHSDTNSHMGKYFAERGYETYSFDYLGHGRSEGQFGTTYNKDILITDCVQFVTKVS